MEPSRVTNFMGGNSYELDPLMTLKIVAASSIFGEPQYYRASDKQKSYLDSAVNSLINYLNDYCVIQVESGKSTNEYFTEIIDRALDFDYRKTLEFAKVLREKYYMRLNPSVILMRAAIHKNRQQFNEENPKIMREIGSSIIRRPDDITNQFNYYKLLKGNKSGLPNIMKRIWSDKLSSYDNYSLKKYLSKNLIDLVRISHAHSENIDAMMKDGDVKVSDDQKTWETLRSQGMKWSEIINTINMPHMALLRNLRGISGEEGIDNQVLAELMTKLKKGVRGGKQFPFRYYSAYKNNTNEIVRKGLEECMSEALENFPKLKGKTISLCDNSGSAHSPLTTFASTKVSTVANLSAIITALNSEEGEIGIFGDRLEKITIPSSDKDKILERLEKANQVGKSIGQATENGIWLFFDEAIKNRLHYDNIFIYSDMQAGHGGLYGKNVDKQFCFEGKSYMEYIDVLKLIKEYRAKVNSKVNVFTVQIAGYNNNLIPQNLYRGAILSGWTGNEVFYASEIINLWDNFEKIKEKMF